MAKEARDYGRDTNVCVIADAYIDEQSIAILKSIAILTSVLLYRREYCYTNSLL